jgi:DUF1680 family protein
MLYSDGTYKTKTENGTALQFKVEGNYPFGDSIRIRISLENSDEFTLSLRIPSWSIESTLKVNGEQISIDKGMTSLTRTWNDGDTVELKLDMRVEALRPTVYHKDIIRSRIIRRTCEMVSEEDVPAPECFEYAAFRRGPLVLACEGTDKSVSIEGHEDTYVDANVIKCERAGLEVMLDNGLRLVDSASAGKEWNEASAFTVWMKNN